MAASTRESLLAYLRVLDGHLVATGKSTPIYLSGGAAVVLAYGSTERTKDVDAFVATRNEILDELQAWAGKHTTVAKREGYFFEVVPPIYPAAPGMFDRALPIQGLNLRALAPFAIELHDIIITKLGRYHAKDSLRHRACHADPGLPLRAPDQALRARARRPENVLARQAGEDRRQLQFAAHRDLGASPRGLG